jgi:molybdopterin synthase catalytic subunit
VSESILIVDDERGIRDTLRGVMGDEGFVADAAERFPVHHIRVVHRCGIVPAGEPIVFAAAAAAHRRPAFEAADFLMDRLKTEAVFWKREDGPSGSTWIEPREADYADRGRWE